MAVFYVSDADGNVSYDGSSPTYVSGTSGPKKTIQQGLTLAGGHADAASTVEVVAGTYTENLSLSSTHNGKAITVQPYASGAVVLTNSAPGRTITAASSQTSGSWRFKNLEIRNTSAGGYCLFRNQNTNPVTWTFEGCTLKAEADGNNYILSNEAVMNAAAYVELLNCTATSTGAPFYSTAQYHLRVTTSTVTTTKTAVCICDGVNAAPSTVVIDGSTITATSACLFQFNYGATHPVTTDLIEVKNGSTISLGSTILTPCAIACMSQYINRLILTDSTWATAGVFGSFGPETELDVSGQLTTRTSDTAGVITASSHKIGTFTTLDLSWTGGARYNCVVDSVGTSTVTFSGGTGDNLPALNTTGMILKQKAVNLSPFTEFLIRGNTFLSSAANPSHMFCIMIGADGAIVRDNAFICSSATFTTIYGGFVCKSKHVTFEGNTVVAGNIVATFKASSGLRCRNNTFYAKTGACFDLTVSQDAGADSDDPTGGYPVFPEVVNNIFYSVDGAAAQFGNNGITLNAQHPLFDHNLYYTGGEYIIRFAGYDISDTGLIAPILAAWAANMTDVGPSRGNDAHSLVADPLFANPAAYDFRARSGSPALTAGYGGRHAGSVAPDYRIRGRQPFLRLANAKVVAT